MLLPKPTMPEETAPTPYDQFPYPAGAYAQSHPDRLETLARLFGMTPPDIRHCRVLELGCADGANLIPMACALPESRFVGVDLSGRQLAPGQETIRELGLENIELRQLDIRQVDPALGRFDYIIAHGVYSWVPAEVQEHLLEVCRAQLAPMGVTYVSYNTYPGWHLRGLLRDMMLYHARKFEEPQTQIEQARALINWLAEAVRDENSPYGLLLRRELEQMQGWKDTYFRHDSLAEVNQPVYFHQFIEQAGRHGLQFLAEAELPAMLASNHSTPVSETLNRLSRGILEMEQYMDFLRNRLFRQTLLCHRDVSLNRSLGPRSLAGFHLGAPVRPTHNPPDLRSETVEEFRSPSEMTVSTGEPITKAALMCLSTRWPGTWRFSELVREARALLDGEGPPAAPGGGDVESDSRVLGGALLTCLCKGVCEVHSHPLAFVLVPGALPQACPCARLQAARGSAVINRRHEQVTLDNFCRRLLTMLDGTRDRAALVVALTRLVADGSLSVSVEGEAVQAPAQVRKIMSGLLEQALRQLARAALLTG